MEISIGREGKIIVKDADESAVEVTLLILIHNLLVDIKELLNIKEV